MSQNIIREQIQPKKNPIDEYIIVLTMASKVIIRANIMKGLIERR